jgi:hypothetical protein
MQRAKDKVPGNSPNPLSRFSVLQQVPDVHLLEVARDSCIVFPSVAGNPTPLLSMIRARDLAQADLALARKKIEQEAHKKKEKDQGKEPKSLADKGVQEEGSAAPEESGGRGPA